MRRQCGLCLVGHVLFAAERAAIRHELHADLVGREVEHCADLVAIVPDSLPARVDVESAVLARNGQRGFRLEERLLDTLGLEDLADHVGRTGQCCIGIPPGVRGS